MTFLRALMLVALVVWLGGIIFFAFVVAPNLFSMLETEEAGNVVRRLLMFLHPMGIICGLVFLICSLLYSRLKFARWKPFAAVNMLVVVMLVFTLISQFRIMPRMDTLRAGIHIIRNNDDTTLANLNVNRAWLPTLQAEFDGLHRWSTRLEGGVLFLGLAAVVLTARRFT